jgi:N-acetylmuramoyl-L-alanine amidase
MKKIYKVIAVALCVFTMGICASTISSTLKPQPAYAIVVKQGNTGATVRKIQQKLKNWGYYKGSVDGIFGSRTKEAIKYFQRKNGLKVDGIAGPKTLAAMGISSSSSSQGSFSNADIELLAKLIHGEARGESYVGQVAV